AGNNLWLVIFAVLMAAVSVYYYFRVIQAMYFKEGDAQPIEVSRSFKLTLVVLAVLIIVFGIYPDLILSHLYF
ncbi:MAG TPA: NADH-quinone oxidoreductase subunit N, partial [Chitinophagaceae bacterium]|nr:NADH-quinone oxidoreductase subunit N [Chitinophagaceae bacterium]